MVKAFLFIAIYLIAWVVYFLIIQRPLFCLYNRSSNIDKMKPSDLATIYKRGFRTDVKVATYMTTIPMFIICASLHFPGFNYQTALLVYNIFISVVIGLIIVADTALYKFWQFKIEASVLAYLRSLKGTFASVSTLYIISAFTAIIVMSAVIFGIIQSVTSAYNAAPGVMESNWINHLLLVFLMILTVGLFFVIIRGLDRRPHNPSVAFYCNNPFYNHCALNPVYNMIYSFSLKEDFSKQFQSMDDEYCTKKFNEFFPTTGTPKIKLLNTDRPNILLIVWESLSARYTASLGGDGNVCPNFDRLAKEGVLFTNCDAGSFRTDRGLVCLISGYLGQPTTSVIKYTSKLPHLPAFPRTLKENGYSTTVLHGGDLTIFHKSDYYWASGHDRSISQKDLPTSAPTGKWGIHDGFTFDWLFNDIQELTKRKERWFTTYQTLSSHETWEVPYSRLSDKITNSFAYVDDCFGKFIDNLKTTPAWDDLLVICVGDHGVNLGPGQAPGSNCHIPLLMLGGAVKEPMKIDTIISQTDLAATLLGQLHIPHQDFIFSRDVLADTYKYPFSFHTYNNGFVFKDATGRTNYDNVAKLAIEGEDKTREECGKIILQKLYQDLSKR